MYTYKVMVTVNDLMTMVMNNIRHEICMIIRNTYILYQAATEEVVTRNSFVETEK